MSDEEFGAIIKYYQNKLVELEYELLVTQLAFLKAQEEANGYKAALMGPEDESSD